MDCRYPYGRGATVDKNRETAGSKTQAIARDARKRASAAARLFEHLAGCRAQCSRDHVECWRRVAAFKYPARTSSNENDDQKPNDRHCQENQGRAKPPLRLRLKTAKWRRIGWPPPELLSVSCHARIMTSTI
jgi:hypothetical protein